MGVQTMNTKRFYWVADCGHEWLAVPEFMARQVDGISSFSYVSPTGDIAYLEGDCDAARFIAHYKLDGAELGATKLYERLAPCRNYPRYECATTTVRCVVCLTDIAASANDDTAICSHCEYNL